MVLHRGQNNFIQVSSEDPHIERRMRMMKAHGPAIRKLIGHDPKTAIWAVVIVGMQLILAWQLKEASLGLILGVSFFVGAVLSHGLYVLIHEAAHNLIFKSEAANRVIAIFCDIVLVCPGAMAFRKYHHQHHGKMGQFAYDPDISSELEAKIVGTNPLLKFVWLINLGISQALRPIRLKRIPFMDMWMVANLFCQIMMTILIWRFIGISAIGYFLLSTVFGLGLHPVGARWIAEHFIISDLQETTSYYGPLNKLSFNVGHHVEHHDFMTIPWSRLPQLKKIAKYEYESLHFYTSYLWVMKEFIFNKEVSLYDRIVRPEKSLSFSVESKIQRQKTNYDPSLQRIEAPDNQKLKGDLQC